MATATETKTVPAASKDADKSNDKAKPTDIEKRAKFRELVSARVGNALSKIKVIGSLANPTAYKYSEKDVEQIRRALTGRVNEVCDRMLDALNKGKANKVSEFHLPEDPA
jgi:hypothetical protein